MNLLKKTSLLFVLGIACGFSANAQTDVTDLLKFLEKAQGDVQKISNAYLAPMGKSLGQGFNNGWYTTAAAHKLGGFDLTISASGVLVSGAMKSFNVNDLGLSALKVASGDGTTPTVLGKDESNTVLMLKNDPTMQKLNLPGGINFPVIPVPMYNVGVGLPFHTEISARFIPTVSFGDGKANLWGFGIKNEFKEFIPVFKMLPFSMSVFYGLTKYNLKWDMTDNEYADKTYKDQKLQADSYSYTTRVLISKSIPFLTVYGGLGYNGSSSDFDLKGHYKIGSFTSIDPLMNNFKSNGFLFNAGLRLKFAVFMLFGDYTYSNYSMFTAGLGVTFR